MLIHTKKLIALLEQLQVYISKVCEEVHGKRYCAITADKTRIRSHGWTRGTDDRKKGCTCILRRISKKTTRRIARYGRASAGSETWKDGR